MTSLIVASNAYSLGASCWILQRYLGKRQGRSHNLDAYRDHAPINIGDKKMKQWFAIITLTFTAASLNAANLIVNGTFSNGLTGWTLSNAGVGLGGEAQVITSLGSLSPQTPGGSFALLDTGPASVLGSSTPTFADLRQVFTLSSTQTLTYSVRITLLTALFTGANASSFDSFTVAILGGPTLFSTTVANPGFSPVPDAAGFIVSSTGANFFEYRPAATVMGTTTLGPGTYSLSLRVANASDSLFDSGMLIEAIVLDDGNTGSSAAPEPGTLLLMASAGVAVVLVKKLRLWMTN